MYRFQLLGMAKPTSNMDRGSSIVYFVDLDGDHARLVSGQSRRSWLWLCLLRHDTNIASMAAVPLAGQPSYLAALESPYSW